MSDPSANPDYAFDRLLRATRTAAEHGDPATRARAKARVERWQKVVAGMADGRLNIGSRTPTAFPAWVTLEVAHGGFVTGEAVAGGALLDHERALSKALGLPDEGARAGLNRHFLTDDGQGELLRALAEHRLHVAVPEEGALVVVAWLIEQGHGAEALTVLDAIEPFFDRLRFHPRIGEMPHHLGALVRRMSVGELIGKVLDRETPRPVQAMNEAMGVWAPLYDRLVALWGETVEGAPPVLGAAGVEGGWPCRRWPADWTARRGAWMANYRAAVEAHSLCGKHRHRKSNFARLRVALERCPQPHSAALSGRDVGWIRRALANTHTRRGTPGSARRNALREAQAAHAARPTHAELAGVLAARLRHWPADSGLPTLDGLDDDVRAGEHPRIAGGTPLPGHITDGVGLAFEAPLAELCDRGIVSSAELLATFTPQITARQRSAGFDDPALRALYEAIYTAFRRRRSVLLLDMSAQVRPEELPWFAALQRHRRTDAGVRQLARETLRELTLLAFTRFPHTITPNPLITELSALAERAGIALPLCSEIAADIFMGRFTSTWDEAARIAARALEGTLYARYYDLPRGGPPKDFAAWCAGRAREAGEGAGGYVARNGTVLEQSQIVTTHNLAALVEGCGLAETLRPLAAGLAARALDWAVDRVATLPGDRRGQLLSIKNAAYAWRQGVFFVSLAPEGDGRAVIDALESARGGVRRARPALRGLRHAFDGGRFDAMGRGVGAPDARRLLGWCLGRHWLVPGEKP